MLCKQNYKNGSKKIKRYKEGDASSFELYDLVQKNYDSIVGVKEDIDKYSDEIITDKETTVFVVVNTNAKTDTDLVKFCSMSTVFHELIEHVQEDFESDQNTIEKTHHDITVSNSEDLDNKASVLGTYSNNFGPEGSSRNEYKSRLYDIFIPKWIITNIQGVDVDNDGPYDYQAVTEEQKKYNGETKTKARRQDIPAF